MHQNKIKELAKSMGVSETDVLCLAQSVVNSIKQDGAADAFSNLSDADRVELTEGYIVHAVRKVKQFTSIYRVNSMARDAFNQTVFCNLA